MPILQLPSEWQPDPITAVYRRIRTSLLAHAGFDALVNTVPGRSSHIGKFPDMSDPKYTRPPANADARDLPEVLLIQSGYVLKRQGSNSMSSEIQQAFDVIVTFDNLQVAPVNALKFNAFVALAAAGDDLGMPRLIRDWDMRDGADDAFGQREWKRDTLRYVSVLRIVTVLSLPRQLVAACFVPTGS
jgi:hypothetical protein